MRFSDKILPTIPMNTPKDGFFHFDVVYGTDKTIISEHDTIIILIEEVYNQIETDLKFLTNE